MENVEQERQSRGRGDAKARAEQRRRRRKAWRVLRPILIALISVAACAGLLYAGAQWVMQKYIDPVDVNDATPVTVTIAKGSGASLIAKTLYEACGKDQQGLIASKAAFKVYVDFTGKASTLKAGTYVLSKNMDIPEIVDIICIGPAARKTTRFTVTEGMYIEDIAKQLAADKIIPDSKEFLALCKSGAEFSDYAFIQAILPEADEDSLRDYMLEGYLFPDTYEIYTDASAKSIIAKMLLKFNDVYTDDYAARAEELGLTCDQVTALASMIEKEAKTEDFAKVSAVFHNRLAQDMKLQSDAPLQYIFKTEGTLDFTREQMASTSPYNTHVHDGLPVGPINNPGEKAIQAALYPDEAYMEEGYLYFVLKTHTSSELVFAKTYEEHLKNKEVYDNSPYEEENDATP